LALAASKLSIPACILTRLKFKWFCLLNGGGGGLRFDIDEKKLNLARSKFAWIILFQAFLCSNRKKNYSPNFDSEIFLRRKPIVNKCIHSLKMGKI